MRLTLCALALGVMLGACTADDGEDSGTDTDAQDTSYEGMRVRKIDAGWRLPDENKIPKRR